MITQFTQTTKMMDKSQHIVAKCYVPKQKYVGKTDEEKLFEKAKELVKIILSKPNNTPSKKSKSKLSTKLKYNIATRYMEYEDLEGEGILAYVKAMNTFDESKGIKFETYASKVITNHFRNILKKSGLKTINNMNDLNYKNEEGDEISFDDAIAKATNDTIASKRGLSEVNKLIHDEIDRIIKTYTNKIDQKVFTLHLTGYDDVEIGKIIGIHYSTVDSIVQRVKSIVKARLKD